MMIKKSIPQSLLSSPNIIAITSKPIVEMTKKINAKAASDLYANIYNTYELGSALDELDLD